MAYFDVGNYGGNKLMNKPGYFNTPGTPPPSPYSTLGPSPSPGAAPDPMGPTPPTDPLDIQPPPQQPSPNPYRQKADDWTSIGSIFNKYVGIEQQFPAQGDVNLWHENVINPLISELASYGVTLSASFDMNGVAHFSVSDPYGDSQNFNTMNDVMMWAQSKVGEYTNRADDYDQFGGFQTGFEEWAANYEAGESQVDPFDDPNGWGAMVKDVFGDMTNLPDMQDLLEGMYNMMPVWEYTADALPNLTAQQRMTKFFDDLKANGFEMDEMKGGLDQELRDWLYAKAKELAPQRMFDQLGLDVSTWNKLNSEQIAEITKMLSRKSVFDDKDTRKYLDIKMRQIKQINQAEYNQHLNVLAEKGITHGGAMVRSAQELYARLGDAEMTATADLFMRGIELAEEGKWQAMGTWSNISATQAKLLTDIGSLKATLFGQYFNFLSDIGNLSANQYATATQAHIAEATLKLKYELGVAELDVQMYISDRGLDIEGLKLEYDNYWRDRGANLDEKQAGFDNAIAAWQTSAMMAEMINAGRSERLVKMANLALAAKGGDMEAWGMYQQLALEETLEQRGMDIDQAQALAELTFDYHTFGEQMDFKRWATEYSGLLQKELLRMDIQGKKELLELKAELEGDGFWGSVLKAVGSLAKLGILLFDKDKKTTDDTTTDDADGLGNAGGGEGG